MSVRRLLRVLSLYAALLLSVTLLIHARLHLDRERAPTGPYLVSVWQDGVRIARRVEATRAAAEGALQAESAGPGARRTIDAIRDSRPISGLGRVILGASVAPGRDGVSVSYQGRSAFATVDDLRKLRAYEKTAKFGPFTIVQGVDVDLLLGAFARELNSAPHELLERGQFHRFAAISDSGYPRVSDGTVPGAVELQRSALAAARYLARNQLPDGSFRYDIDAMTGVVSSDYNFPRHSGATYFLARAANQLHDVPLLNAAKLAGTWLRDHSTLRCGAHACVGQGERVDVGSSALALLAYVELAEGGVTEFRESSLDLAAFVRSQQRADGEFQHRYDIIAQRPIDVQFEYYTGEAALALSRVARLSGDMRDLQAASRALAFLVHRSPWFLGSRYFWGAEHWTCQALEDLWQRAPNHAALDFCLAWQASTRAQQLEAPSAPAEYDGALSRGPFAPRLTTLASRLEAAVATLAVARTAHLPPSATRPLEQQIERGLSFLMRYQFSPGPSYLMPTPGLLAGAFPGSPVDLHVRIDFPQHAGCALLRYAALQAP